MRKRPVRAALPAKTEQQQTAVRPVTAERLQKYMARCGVDSRRKCEELIAAGLVEVNGVVVREPGVKIDPARDRVRVNGKALRTEKPAYYIHYKMKGVTTTVADDLGRRTVMDCLPDIRERVYPVGRLDKESEGLLVLTNDGEMANYLTHPAHGVEKTYRVVAEGRIEAETLRALGEKGMRLGPVLVKPSRVELVRYDTDSTVLLISVGEGINREVRRIFAALGHEVKKLLRVQVGPLSLMKMKRGTTRPLTQAEIERLRKGMAGAAPQAEAQAEAFGPGTARSRKPTGPRGRGRPEPGRGRGRGKPAGAGRRERPGKPDPAAATARPARPHGPERKPIAAKPGRPLRPERKRQAAAMPTAAKAISAKAERKPVAARAIAAKPERKPSAPPASRHPLAGPRPVGGPRRKAPARPGGKSAARPTGRPERNKPGRKSTAKPTGKLERHKPTGKPERNRPTGKPERNRPTGKPERNRPTGKLERHKPERRKR